VLRSEAGFCQLVLDDGRVVTARLLKGMKSGPRETTTLAVIGDRVRVATRGASAVIEEVCERSNELSRQAPGRPALRDVLAANLDVLLLVQSTRNPDFNSARLDRFLAIAEQAGVPPVVVLNKIDLVGAEEVARVAGEYVTIGYRVITSSVKQGVGIEEVREALHGLAALVGPSGAGKSSLLNAIKPGFRLRTADVSEATSKGRHTTVASELLALTPDTYVADTPGLRSIALTGVPPEDLDWLFPEFRPFARECRFGNCLHQQETGCAVLEALASGAISQSRYAGYRHLLEEALEQDRTQYG